MLCELVSEMKTPQPNALCRSSLSSIEFDLFYKIMMANRTAAKVAPIVKLFLPAELVVCCVGVLVALIVLFDVAKVVFAGVPTVVATPAYVVAGAGTPVTRAASPLDVPTVVKTT